MAIAFIQHFKWAAEFIALFSLVEPLEQKWNRKRTLDLLSKEINNLNLHKSKMSAFKPQCFRHKTPLTDNMTHAVVFFLTTHTMIWDAFRICSHFPSRSIFNEGNPHLFRLLISLDYLYVLFFCSPQNNLLPNTQKTADWIASVANS